MAIRTFKPHEDEMCRKLIDHCRNSTAPVIEACIACGLDMQEEQQANADQLKVAEKLLEQFGVDGVIAKMQRS